MAKEHTQQTLVHLTGLTQPRISQYIRDSVINRNDHPIIANRK
jgi:hypothetical protein